PRPRLGAGDRARERLAGRADPLREPRAGSGGRVAAAGRPRHRRGEGRRADGTRRLRRHVRAGADSPRRCRDDLARRFRFDRDRGHAHRHRRRGTDRARRGPGGPARRRGLRPGRPRRGPLGRSGDQGRSPQHRGERRPAVRHRFGRTRLVRGALGPVAAAGAELATGSAMCAGAALFGLSPVLLLTIGIVVGVLPSLDCRRNGHRLLIVALFVFLAVRYYYWRISGVILYGAQDGAHGWFAGPVLGFELLGIAEAIVAVIMMSRTVDRKPETDVKAAALAARPDAELPAVDVFIATSNEDLDVLEKTILGAMALDWPAARLKIWVLDDGRRAWLRDFCAAKRVGYLTRPNNAHAKAGNINAALKQTSGEFVSGFR